MFSLSQLVVIQAAFFVEKLKFFKKFWVIKTGKRGGKYNEAETKDGRPYRRYK